MSDKHTPTPWRLPKTAPEEYLSPHQIVADTGQNFPRVLFTGNPNHYEQAQIDAVRVVACVNACEGISTKWLLKNATGCIDDMHSTVMAEARSAKYQRDELLEILKEVVRISDRKHDAWDKAHAAIAKIERN